jgi:peptidoglycan/LPS O-acetylase OafA/YrhL
MADSNENMRDRLLARMPRPENAAEYRNEVAAMLEKNEKLLRRETWGTAAIWAFVVLLGTALMVRAGWKANMPAAAFIGTFVCFFMIGGAVELLKHFINRSRVELLKEIKQVQLQVLELQAAMRKENA